jgi:hypothetical protein
VGRHRGATYAVRTVLGAALERHGPPSTERRAAPRGNRSGTQRSRPVRTVVHRAWYGRIVWGQTMRHSATSVEVDPSSSPIEKNCNTLDHDLHAQVSVHSSYEH